MSGERNYQIEIAIRESHQRDRAFSLVAAARIEPPQQRAFDVMSPIASAPSISGAVDNEVDTTGAESGALFACKSDRL